MLSQALVKRGHSVRGTTRDPGRRSEIEGTGAECVLADPDRLGTLVPALAHVSVLVVLLGSAQGPPARLAELHGPRLEMLLHRVTDSPVHAVVYEARGSVDSELLAAGARSVRDFGARNLTPTGLLEADPARPSDWLQAAVATVEGVLEAGAGH